MNNPVYTVADRHDTHDVAQVSRTNSMQDRRINQKVLNFVTARVRRHPNTSVHETQGIILKTVGLNKVRLRQFRLKSYARDARGNACGSSCEVPATVVRL